jgi:hypothetical protein
MKILSLLILVLAITPFVFAVDPAEEFEATIKDPISGTKANVVVDGGLNKVAVLSTTIVEQVFGKDPNATTFFFFGNLDDANGIGAAGDTIRVQIPAAPSPHNTLYPAVDVTTTVTAGHVADSRPERAVALQVCTDLNADANFIAAKWVCEVAKDFAYMHIRSTLFNEFGHRSSYTLTCSGGTVCTFGESDIIRRGKETELSRSPNDPARLGILAIAGSVVSTPGGVGDIIAISLENSLSSSDMRLDCNPFIAGTCEFELDCSATQDRLITELRIFLGCNGIKFGQFACKNTDLSTGVEVDIRANGETLVLPNLKSTEDFKNKFAFGPAGPGGQFRIDVQAGGDQMVASLSFQNPAKIRKCTGTNDDFIKVKISDDLDGSPGGNLNEFEALAFGFERTP